ncbi:FixH family protein [uncultured Phyllobacterium sp.]|uniref:FixH family protein n=1 Tax=uncultured Phyllobacterium sp. TaxID=253813 RepID=UPI0025885C70|nr:FixH family protein [uncultured Phyllobacterium sp.]
MKINRSAFAGLALAALLASMSSAHAAPSDYEFKLVTSEIQKNDAATIAVRLIDKRSGKPVENAVISATRIDMQPDGMEMMITPAKAMPTTEAGVYSFKTNLSMAGNWRFSVAAKVQGEEGTVENKLVFKVVQ